VVVEIIGITIKVEVTIGIIAEVVVVVVFEVSFLNELEIKKTIKSIFR
jgi:hypothetical protein